MCILNVVTWVGLKKEIIFKKKNVLCFYILIRELYSQVAQNRES